MESEYKELLDQLFRLPEVRYAVILDELGERVAGGMKPGVKSVTSPSDEAKLERQALIILGMARGYESKTGSFQLSSVRWKDVVAAFFFLKEKRTLAVTFDAKSVPVSEVLERVRRMASKAQ